MQNYRFKISLLVLVAATIYASCRKTDSQFERTAADNTKAELSARFFSAKPGTPIAATRVLEEIRQRDNNLHFISDFALTNGLAQWDKAIVTLPENDPSHNFGNNVQNGDTIVYIPLVLTNTQYTNGFIRGVLNDTISISNWVAGDYRYFPVSAAAGETSRNQYASMIMLMDNQVFGATKFKLTDSSLLLPAGSAATGHERLAKITSIDTVSGSNLCTGTIYTVSWLVQDAANCSCTNGANSPGGHCSDWQTGCAACSNTVSITIQVGDGGCGGGVSTPPSPTNPSGGSSGGTWNTGPVGGGGTGGTGWIGIVPLGGIYNPNAGAAVFSNTQVTGSDLNRINNWRRYNLDTSGLDSCRMQILNRLINTLGTSPLGVFLSKLDKAVGTSNTLDKFIIHFKTKPLIGYNALTQAATYDEISHVFEVDIVLDSVTSKNATDIFLANTLFHEVVHAYMTFIWKKLNQGATQQQIQDLNYDQVFNAYVDTLRIRDSLNPRLATLESESIQHNYMADQLLDYIANTIRQFDNNPTTSDRYYWYLAWTGLTRKQVRTWKQHWPNFPSWPPSNPAPIDDSTRGLKYALTLNRIDSIYNKVLENEEKSLPGAKGKKPLPGGCY